MIMPFVEVRILKVICDNMESSSAEHDAFALTGAVVVDEKVHAFAIPAVPLKTGWTFSYFAKVFDGWVDNADVGFGVVGFDVDNSDWWVKNKNDIDAVTTAIAEAFKLTPLPIIGEVVDKIPEVVDFFTKRDKDDVVLRWSGVIDAPDVVSGESTRVFQKRYRGAKYALGLPVSDWNYAVDFSITWKYPAPLFGKVRRVRWSTRPLSRSTVEEWLGFWTAPGITCDVRRSASLRPHSVDVTLTDGLSGNDVVTFTRDAPIQGVGVEVTQTFRENTTLQEALKQMNGTTAVPEVWRPDAEDLLIEKHPLALDFLEFDDTPGQAINTVPVWMALGGDRVELDNGGMLEIRATLVDGTQTTGRKLRYVNPGRATDMILLGDVDMELERFKHL